MDKVSKVQANYIDTSPTPTAMSCYICTMFRAPNGCDLVEGDISPEGVSDFFQRDLRFDVAKSTQLALAKGHDTMNENNLRMYLPITKVDAVNRLVYGLATAEQPDVSGEVCDYSETKPYYEKWSKNISEASNGKSLGNIRAMHGKTAAGKVTELTFNDDAKQIEICAKIVDDQEWKKVEQGVYTGFSQGGAYVKRWKDPQNPRLTRYVADPIEVSLVDIPCLPTATFQLIKSVGAVQEVEIRTFQPVSNEQGVHEALEKFKSFEDAGGSEERDVLEKVGSQLRGDAAGDETSSTGAGDSSKDQLDKSASGGQTTEQKAPNSEKDDLEKAQHNPGREAQVAAGELPTEGTSGDTREAVKVPGDAEHSDTSTVLTPGSWNNFGQKVDPGDSNKEKEGSATSFEPKTREGNSGSAAELTNDRGSGADTGSVGKSGGEASGGSEGSGDSEGSQNYAVSQMWLAKDGKPFSKKTEALAWNEELDRQELLREVTGPADKALESLKGALDKVDGGEIRIHDAQSFDRAWQDTLAGTQTRAGVQPLGKIYSSVDDLPPAVKSHFKGDDQKLRQWMHVWNNVYSKSQDEEKAFAQAWSAAEKSLSDDQVQKRAKPYGDVEYADPGYQKDGQSRYPLDTQPHIRAAWSYIHMPRNAGKYAPNQLATVKSKIDSAWKSKIEQSPPNPAKLSGSDLLREMGVNLSKHLYDVGEVACTILRLEDLRSCLEMEAVREGDDSTTATELQRNISSLCQFLRNLVEEETTELVMGTEDMAGDDGDDGGSALLIVTRAAVGPNANYLHGILDKAIGQQERDAEKAAKDRGLKYTKSPSIKLVDALEKVGRRLGQVNRMHLQAAHDHISAMTDGATCDEGDTEKWVTKAGAALSQDTRSKLKKAHDHLSEMGADCSMSKGALLRSTDEEISSFEKGMGFGDGALKKIADENIVLKKAFGQVVGQVATLTKRVEELASTPLPPKGVKRVVALEKGADMGGGTSSSYATGAGNPAEAFAKHLEGLTPDERAIEMIKFAQRSPVIRTNGY